MCRDLALSGRRASSPPLCVSITPRLRVDVPIICPRVAAAAAAWWLLRRRRVVPPPPPPLLPLPDRRMFHSYQSRPVFIRSWEGGRWHSAFRPVSRHCRHQPGLGRHQPASSLPLLPVRRDGPAPPSSLSRPETSGQSREHTESVAKTN